MLRLSITYDSVAELQRTLADELARGVLLVKIAPPPDLEFRAPVRLTIASAAGSFGLDTEVVSILPGIGVAVTFPAAKLDDARALLRLTPDDGQGCAAVHAIESEAIESGARAASEAAPKPAGPERTTSAEKIRMALHGSREDRAAILREPSRAYHQYVLKSPQVTIDEVTAWVKNPQMSADFLKQIADRKEWLSRPAIAQGLVRNPKVPPDIALRALDHVGMEALRQMAKGIGAPPHIVAAARKKMVGK